MIPARYYLSEEGGKLTAAESTTAVVAARSKKKGSKKKSYNRTSALSRLELQAKLREKIDAVKKQRQKDPEKDGKRRRQRGEKRARSEGVAFASVVQQPKTSELHYEDPK